MQSTWSFDVVGLQVRDRVVQHPERRRRRTGLLSRSSSVCRTWVTALSWTCPLPFATDSGAVAAPGDEALHHDVVRR